MSAQRFVRQLRREVKAHPKRAMLLAALTAVGVYFWAPLVADWVAPDQSTVAPAPAKKNATPPAGGTAKPDSAVTTPQKTPNATSWTRLWAAIREDERTQPSRVLSATADPFRPFPALAEPEENADAQAVAQETTEAQQSTTVARPASPADATPRSLGMKLTGTIIGPRRRAAVIDGKVVAEGMPVVSGGASSNDAAAAPEKANNQPATLKQPKFTFRLARVAEQSVVLERNGKSYELAIELPKVTGVDIAAIEPKTPN